MRFRLLRQSYSIRVVPLLQEEHSMQVSPSNLSMQDLKLELSSSRVRALRVCVCERERGRERVCVCVSLQPSPLTCEHPFSSSCATSSHVRLASA